MAPTDTDGRTNSASGANAGALEALPKLGGLAGLETARLTTDIVVAYLARNDVPLEKLSDLIAMVHETLVRAIGAEPVNSARPAAPAVPIDKSITDEHLICLEDGLAFKSLKRHLMTRYKLTPEQYRERWSLPADYPMVSPRYARARSALARKMGLGTTEISPRRQKGRTR